MMVYMPTHKCVTRPQWVNGATQVGPVLAEEFYRWSFPLNIGNVDRNSFLYVDVHSNQPRVHVKTWLPMTNQCLILSSTNDK